MHLFFIGIYIYLSLKGIEYLVFTTISDINRE